MQRYLFREIIHTYKSVLKMTGLGSLLQVGGFLKIITRVLGFLALRNDWNISAGVLKLNPNDGEAKRYLEIAKVKKMEEKLEEKKLDILVDAQGDAKLPEGW